MTFTSKFWLAFTWSFLVLVLLLCPRPSLADARPALSLRGTWFVEAAAIQPAAGLIWRAEQSGSFCNGAACGGAFAQARAFPASEVKGCAARNDGSGRCKRLRIRAEKPTDKAGSIAIQFPGRTERRTAPAGVPYAEIILWDLSLDDYGIISIQLTVEGAEVNSYGVLNLNTHDQDLDPAAVAAVMVDGRQLSDGESVPKGWRFLFFGTAKKLEVTEDPIGLLSLCGFYPSGQYECSDGNALDVRVTRRGEYLFVAWSKKMQAAFFTVRGV